MTAMKSPWMVLAASVVLVGGLAALLLWKGEPDKPEPLILQCAAALREPIEAIIPTYEQQTGQRIEVRYGESQKVLTDLEMSKQGDLFLPADDSYIIDAQKKGLLDDVIPLATMNAALAVKSDSGKQILEWNDLLKDDIGIAIANPEAAAISRIMATRLGARWNHLQKRATALGPVTQVANAIKVGRGPDAGRPIHAGFIWDSMFASPNYSELKIVPLRELEGITATVKVGVVKGGNRTDAAKAFAMHLSNCGNVFKQYGFTPLNPTSVSAPEKVGGEIVLYAGSMLRPAIEDTITEFEKREGVRVIRVYNGCGILVSQMKAGERPDVYFSCDTTFMNQVEDLFDRPKNVSKNQLVIAVKKGNPHGIKSLKDLGKEGLRVGVGHEQQCALGAITQSVLIRSRTLKAVQNNILVRSPSGDLLVNQLLTGSLDAVVAYVSNVKPYDDKLDGIRVEEVNCAPTQPIAVSKSTANPEAVKRLLKALETAQSKDRFEKLGFGWELQP
jgi:molybdate transport system substrate-binding protein